MGNYYFLFLICNVGWIVLGNWNLCPGRSLTRMKVQNKWLSKIKVLKYKLTKFSYGVAVFAFLVYKQNVKRLKEFTFFKTFLKFYLAAMKCIILST